jgi:hypothetical protein
MEFSLFSKLLGPGPQGVMMGWLTSSGCLARAIGPLYITQLYADYGPRITFMVASGLCVCPFICLLIQKALMVLVGVLNYKQFVPHQLYSLDSGRNGKTRSILVSH